MSERAQQLPIRVQVAAAAIANEARAVMGQPPIALEAFDHRIQARAIASARVALAAIDDHEAALLADLQNPDAVSIADVEGLAAAIDAGTIAFLVRDRLGRARAVLWARSAQASLLTGEPAQALWSGLARAVRDLPEASSPSEEPAP